MTSFRTDPRERLVMAWAFYKSATSHGDARRSYTGEPPSASIPPPKRITTPVLKLSKPETKEETR